MRFAGWFLLVVGLVGCGGSNSSSSDGTVASSLASSVSSSSLSSSSSSSLSSSSSSSVASSVSSSVVSSSSSSLPAVDYSSLKPSQPTEVPLARLSSLQLERLIKNGLRLQLSSYGYPVNRELEDIDVSDADFSPRPPASVSSGEPSYSDTNVHVDGVDESDVVKYDGKHWFVAHIGTESNGNIPGIQVVATEPDVPDAHIVGQYLYEDAWWGMVSQMYMEKNASAATQLVTLKRKLGNLDAIMPTATPTCISDPWFTPANGRIQVDFIDVSTPSTPNLAAELTLDGTLIDSRRVGDILYIISRYDPWVTDLGFETRKEDARDHNESLLQQATLTQLLPHYEQNGTSQPLSDTCLAQSDIDSSQGFHSLVHTTAINIRTRSLVASECVSAGVSSMTMSPDNLYLTGTIWGNGSRKTVIHKFNLSDSGAIYAATGSVQGSVSDDAPFRISEHDDHLRVVTTNLTENWDIVHRLFVLTQFDQSLEVIAQLPNDARPERLGKPGEDIFAVRFAGDKAYVVTFQLTDPLYVIDLSDELDPKITGELEVPGFATYIHPINDQYLFTLGQDADAQTGWNKGIKAQLIKINAGVPILTGELLIGDRYSYSEALSDLRALNVLDDGAGKVRIAFPVVVYEQNQQNQSKWQYSGLQTLELNDLLSANGTMQDKGVLIADTDTSQRYSPIRRGLLHDDAVFYTQNNNIWVGEWGKVDAAMGPIGNDDIVCTEELRNGLKVQIVGEYMIPLENCDARVVAVDGDFSQILTPLLRENGPNCYFVGAEERAGSYTITADLSGYMSETITGVEVTEDACHVQTHEVAIQLESNSDT
ncbi:beta-propeller domain-containing protein [Gilvimarinus polysaccharolyticus]|uniref:beta-propeller domain-containing protein n=1 Tax=Gilvimarinus polysaccharolyticus TaxID=863921 RepID=UPI00067367BB|nr:beta-propeller domain-containing protein [Gilvimarinus polysaccharolyticus]